MYQVDPLVETSVNDLFCSTLRSLCHIFPGNDLSESGTTKLLSAASSSSIASLNMTMPASCEGVGALSNSTVDPIPALLALLTRPHIPVVQLYIRGELTRNDVFRANRDLCFTMLCVCQQACSRVSLKSRWALFYALLTRTSTSVLWKQTLLMVRVCTGVCFVVFFTHTESLLALFILQTGCVPYWLGTSPAEM